jgi:hypothetical protein
MRTIPVRVSAGRIALALCLTLIGAGVWVDSPAAADPVNGVAGRSTEAPARPTAGVPVGFATWTEVFAMQDRLNAAAEKIVAAGGEGYVGIVAAPAARALRVYWHGTVPASLRTLTRGLDVPVTFLPAKYTEREMIAETRRLAADPRVRSIGPEVDGGGLRITVTGAGRQAIQAGSGTVGSARMPLHIESGPAPRPLARSNDVSPYWGGGRFSTPGTGCTTGFAVLWNGLDHMLSAGHCGNDGQLAVDGGGNPAVDTMGDIFNDNNSRDTLMINTPSQGNVYVGPSSSSVSVDVIGAAADFVGNVVCTGGARTGEHCGIPVTHVNQSDFGYFPLTRAAYPTAACAGARGDSGGPAYTYSGTAAVVGRGTISTGRPGTASCPNASDSESSQVVYYAPLVRPSAGPTVGSLQFYGATIL